MAVTDDEVLPSRWEWGSGSVKQMIHRTGKRGGVGEVGSLRVVTRDGR